MIDVYIYVFMLKFEEGRYQLVSITVRSDGSYVIGYDRGICERGSEQAVSLMHHPTWNKTQPLTASPRTSGLQ